METKISTLTLITVLAVSCNLTRVFGDLAQSLCLLNPFHSSMCGKAPCDSLIVTTPRGKVQGRAFESKLDNSEYYAFLGIPYAKPPVGELRFRTPEPATSWKGVYPAYYEKNICKQVDILFKVFRVGSEDCLYLNVYTPEVPRKITRRKAVIVSIHGGGFNFLAGSQMLYSPDYLVTRDVIVVSINYRLSALGFLNLGISECAGNMGLKDQVLALKWVKKNIRSFGGDPNDVTIFGESAGGTSVNYHLLSPMSKGLFHKAIMHSGSSMTPWALLHKPVSHAFDIGRRCGYKGNNTDELLQFLKNKSSNAILFATASWFMEYRQIYPAGIILLGPSVEVSKEGAFIPDWPSNLAKSAIPVPTIFGANDKEGTLLLFGLDNKSVQRVGRNFSLLVSNNFRVKAELIEEASEKIKRFYFGDRTVGMETANELVDLYTHLIGYYTYDAVEFLINSTTPPYLYEFVYHGNLNYIMKATNLLLGTKLPGASHADDMLYLFHPRLKPGFIPIDDRSRKMIETMTTMWTNFAKTGNPSGLIRWNPSTMSEPAYLLIDENPRMVPGEIYGEKLEFLKSVLDPIIEPGTQPYDIF